MLEHNHPDLSVRSQCKLLNLSRASLYYKQSPLSPEIKLVLDRLDEIYTEHPYYGSRRFSMALKREGYQVGRMKARGLMRTLGIEALYPGKKLSTPNKGHKIYPYLLRGVSIDRPNKVWSSDITYIRLNQGFVYLVAVIDHYSRYILSWRLSNTLEGSFCHEALQAAIKSYGVPEYFNTDQGSQFTCERFILELKKHQIKISMDGKGRALDNIYIERFWRTLKYEEVYIKSYQDVLDCKKNLSDFFYKYNYQRLHQSTGYKPPAEAYHGLEVAC
jgi:putative transposase